MSLREGQGMEYNLMNYEALKMDIRLPSGQRAERSNAVWKNLVRIEQLKRQKINEKNSLLRSRIQCKKTECIIL